MLPIGCGRLGVQLPSPNRTTMGKLVGGRTKQRRTCSELSLAITPTRCQQQSANEDGHDEHGQHVDRH